MMKVLYLEFLYSPCILLQFPYISYMKHSNLHIVIISYGSQQQKLTKELRLPLTQLPTIHRQICGIFGCGDSSHYCKLLRPNCLVSCSIFSNSLVAHPWHFFGKYMRLKRIVLKFTCIRGYSTWGAKNECLTKID